MTVPWRIRPGVVLAGKALIVSGLFALTPPAQSTPLIDLRDSLLAREAAAGHKGRILAAETFGPDFRFGDDSWRWTRRVHGQADSREQILSCCRHALTDRGVRLTTAAGINRFSGPTGRPHQVSNEITTTLDLAEDMAGSRIRANFVTAGRGAMEALIVFVPSAARAHIARGNANARGLSVEASVPAGAQRAVCGIRLSGVGEAVVTAAEITLAQPPTDADAVDVMAYPHGYLDEKYFVPPKTPFPLTFMFKRNKKITYRDVVLHLELPQGYRCVGLDLAMQRVGEVDGACRIDVTRAVNATITDGDFCIWRVCPILLLSELEPTAELRTMPYHIEMGNKAMPGRILQLGTAEPLAGRTPQRFITGVMQQAGGNYDGNDAVSFVNLLQSHGFNALQSPKSEALNDLLQARGIVRYGNAWGIRDGYPRGRSPGREFIGVNGKQFNGQLCPTEVYTRGDYYRDVLEQKIIDPLMVEALDHFSNNWEAYSSDYKGCFCEHCLREFAAYAHIPEEKVRALWPLEVIAKYHDQWVAFRSWQHGRVVATLEASVNAAGRAVGKESHFIPMLSVATFHTDSKFGLQYHPKDFLKDLKMVNVWGPYSHAAGMRRAYRYTPGLHLRHYFAVREVMRFTRNHGGEQVRVLGFPYGCHGTNVNTPEGIALETVSNFISGYSGSFVYWFFFDSRYWGEMAKANDLIATYEDMVLEWETFSAMRITPKSDIIGPRHWEASITSFEIFPEMETATTALQLQAWRHGDKYLAAVGNFWELGDAFFTLALSGQAGELVVSQPHRNRCMRVSASQLGSAGVLLHLPPLKWDFFLIEPYDEGKNYGREFAPESMAALLQDRQDAIRSAMAVENTLLAEFRKITEFEDYDFGVMPEVVAGKVSLRELELDGRQALEITSADYRAELEPAQGGRIRSLRIFGQEAVVPSGALGFGKIAFWQPTRTIFEKACQIVSVTPAADHVRVVLERADDGNGLKVRLSYGFFADRISQTATITNVGKHRVELVCRFHHLLAHLSRRDGRLGHFTIGDAKIEIEPVHRLFVHTEMDDSLKRRIITDDPIRVTGRKVVFTAPFLALDLVYEAVTPLHGYYMWNHPGAAAGTFEPTFVGQTLAIGESHSVTQRWTWRRH